MTQTQIVERFLAGEHLMLGEFRLSAKEILNWRDKTTGAAKSGPIVRHTVEFGQQSVAVNERVPDGQKLEDIVCPFSKGDSVVLHVDEWTTNKGLVSCRGRLEKVQPALVPPNQGALPVTGRGK